ncbi:MAG: hypothetical protein GWN45_02095, partial [Gammaproteobacteria bacterium]|nr:hypothetical protein [Gammaproteobacteria bacterium]
QDSDPLDPFLCGDADLDTCEDCTSGVSDLFNDGPDQDGDGLCDPADLDVDGDGVDDADDSHPLD